MKLFVLLWLTAACGIRILGFPVLLSHLLYVCLAGTLPNAPLSAVHSISFPYYYYFFFLTDTLGLPTLPHLPRDQQPTVDHAQSHPCASSMVSADIPYLRSPDFPNDYKSFSTLQHRLCVRLISSLRCQPFSSLVFTLISSQQIYFK